MALHGGGHLELKKMHKGDFWGIFGIRLGRCPGIIPEKISFLQFYSRFLCFFVNALALKNIVLTKTYLKPKAVLARPENSPQETNPDRNQWVHHKLASANVIIASRVYQFLLNQILETTIAPLIYLYYL